MAAQFTVENSEIFTEAADQLSVARAELAKRDVDFRAARRDLTDAQTTGVVTWRIRFDEEQNAKIYWMQQADCYKKLSDALRAENERLREALKVLLDHGFWPEDDSPEVVAARVALAGAAP